MDNRTEISAILHLIQYLQYYIRNQISIQNRTISLFTIDAVHKSLQTYSKLLKASITWKDVKHIGFESK